MQWDTLKGAVARTEAPVKESKINLGDSDILRIFFLKDTHTGFRLHHDASFNSDGSELITA